MFSNLRHSLSKNCILQNKVLERKTKNTSNLRHSLSKNCILQNKVLERKTKNTSNDSTVHSGCSYKKKLEVLTRFVAKEDYVQSNSFHDRNDRTTLVSTKKDDKQELKRKHTDNELNKKKVRMKLFFDSKTNKRCVQKFRFRNIENAIGTINAMYDYEPLNRNQKQNPKSILGEELSPSHCRITDTCSKSSASVERERLPSFRVSIHVMGIWIKNNPPSPI
ncbi:hypothetical protein TNCV_2878161 [Trichonephila clavipes]|uniref:Uncharacterized protein n=1 Tax=Trichonephila clavipes TaxID=2585209 RepID=A0A8X6W1T5_TRICX|nr:hypothetical protein TNCV_2878161 [Trichonephila clavipes]